jgi:hypothetical protein
MGYEAKIAKRYLLLGKNDVEKALDLIREDEINGTTIAIDAPLPTLAKVKSGTSSNLEYTPNPLIRMLLFVSTELENSTKKCHICGKDLAEQSLKPRPCTSQVCEFIFEENQTGSVLTELMHYPNESHFDISIAGKALTS